MAKHPFKRNTSKSKRVGSKSKATYNFIKDNPVARKSALAGVAASAKYFKENRRKETKRSKKKFLIPAGLIAGFFAIRAWKNSDKEADSLSNIKNTSGNKPAATPSANGAQASSVSIH